jgi:hypothetical protein
MIAFVATRDFSRSASSTGRRFSSRSDWETPCRRRQPPPSRARNGLPPSSRPRIAGAWAGAGDLLGERTAGLEPAPSASAEKMMQAGAPPHGRPAPRGVHARRNDNPRSLLELPPRRKEQLRSVVQRRPRHRAPTEHRATSTTLTVEALYAPVRHTRFSTVYCTCAKLAICGRWVTQKTWRPPRAPQPAGRVARSRRCPALARDRPRKSRLEPSITRARVRRPGHPRQRPRPPPVDNRPARSAPDRRLPPARGGQGRPDGPRTLQPALQQSRDSRAGLAQREISACAAAASARIARRWAVFF